MQAKKYGKLHFCSRLKEVMKQNSLTQKDLEAATKIHQTSISDYLRGKSIPSAAALADLAEALHVSMDYLWGRENQPTGTLTTDQKNTDRALEAERRLAELASLLPQFSELNTVMAKILSKYTSHRQTHKK